MPHLSVSTVIPTYNRARLVERAIRSAVPQCEPGDEIIVVDDGSTDDTEAVVRAVGSPVRYVRGEHRGQGAALNLGVRESTGDLVALLDSDDEWMPEKLSWQRAVMRQFPEVLFLFSDFAHVSAADERFPHQLPTWHSDARPWDEILGPGTSSATIADLPASAPLFKLHVGSVYEGLIFHFYICTSTFVVRRKEAGEALWFAEDLPMFGDYECFARLAARGLGGYMDCDTEWNHGHLGGRLTDADPIVRSDTLVTITERVWGADGDYLRLHRPEYEAALDTRRLQKVRYLLGRGRPREARQELARCHHRPASYAAATHVPARLMAFTAESRRRLLKLDRADVAPSSAWRITEHRGRAGLKELEEDWRRLYAGMPNKSRYHAFEAQLAYADHFCQAPSLLRYLALKDGQGTRAICPLEARSDVSLRTPIPVWGLPLNTHWLVTDVLCKEDEARRELIPALVAHLRAQSAERGLLVLGPLPAASGLWDGLSELDSSEYCSRATAGSAYFDCTKPYDELIGRFTKHFARNLRSHRKKVEQRADARYVTAAGPDLDAELEAFMAVEASGWKGEVGTGSAISLHPRLVGFYRDVATSMHGGDDRCEINSLYMDGVCAASQFCVRTGGDYTILKIGYDEKYSRLGPGQVLLDRTLKRCCDDPAVERLDLVTNTAWFRDWRTSTTPMKQAHIAIGRWRGRPLVGLLKIRFGWGRRLVRWLGAQPEAARQAAEQRSHASKAGKRGKDAA